MKGIKKLFSTGFAWLWVTALVIIIDRLTKMWVVANISFHDVMQITSFFNLTLAYNKGAAFSFLNDAPGWQNMFFVNLAWIVCALLLYWLYKLPARSWWMSIALCLVIGGALGNAWDRIIYGYVIDFLDFHWNAWHFAVFNGADSAICVGAAMLILDWKQWSK